MTHRISHKTSSGFFTSLAAHKNYHNFISRANIRFCGNVVKHFLQNPSTGTFQQTRVLPIGILVAVTYLFFNLGGKCFGNELEVEARWEIHERLSHWLPRKAHCAVVSPSFWICHSQAWDSLRNWLMKPLPGVKLVLTTDLPGLSRLQPVLSTKFSWTRLDYQIWHVFPVVKLIKPAGLFGESGNPVCHEFNLEALISNQIQLGALFM